MNQIVFSHGSLELYRAPLNDYDFAKLYVCSKVCLMLICSYLAIYGSLHCYADNMVQLQMHWVRWLLRNIYTLVMHRYHFLLADPIPIYFILKLANTWPIPILCHRGIIYFKQPIFPAVYSWPSHYHHIKLY